MPRNTATATYEKFGNFAVVEVHILLAQGGTGWKGARVERPLRGTLTEACRFVARQNAALADATLLSFARASTAPVNPT